MAFLPTLSPRQHLKHNMVGILGNAAFITKLCFQFGHYRSPMILSTSEMLMFFSLAILAKSSYSYLERLIP